MFVEFTLKVLFVTKIKKFFYFLEDKTFCESAVPNSFRQIRPKGLARDRHSNQVQQPNYLFKGGARRGNVALKKEREWREHKSVIYRKRVSPYVCEVGLNREPQNCMDSCQEY